MDNFVQIGHDAKLGKNCFLGAHASVGGVTVVKDNVSIWSMSAVNKDLVIAEGTVVLAYSGVDKDTQPGQTYFGIPAVEVRKKWREIATLKSLPDLIAKLDK
jgi:UDP-3-O-[3-hydroxymyristoyl] glucosamine N-acyltransferase